MLQLEVSHHFGVANALWSHGAVERTNREVMKTFRVILSKRRWPPSNRLLPFGAVQWALKSAYREHITTKLLQMMSE